MTEERPVQAQECYEHHMLLKGQLERINHFLFGDPEHPDDLSVTAKVNLMFNVLLEMDNIAEKLDTHIRQTDAAIQNLEQRLLNVEEIVYRK